MVSQMSGQILVDLSLNMILSIGGNLQCASCDAAAIVSVTTIRLLHAVFWSMRTNRMIASAAGTGVLPDHFLIETNGWNDESYVAGNSRIAGFSLNLRVRNPCWPWSVRRDRSGPEASGSGLTGWRGLPFRLCDLTKMREGPRSWAAACPAGEKPGPADRGGRL
jgi:hypothetical protein